MSSLLLQTLDLNTEGPPPEQALLGVVIIIGLVAVVSILKTRMRYGGLPEGQKRHVVALVGQLQARTPTTLRWTPEELRERPHAAKQAVADALTDDTGDVQPERASAPQAVRELQQAWGEGLTAATDHIPRAAAQLLSLAGVVAIFGPIAVWSTDRWRDAIADGKGGGSALVDVAIALRDLTIGVGNAVTDLLLSFPFIGDLYAIAFTLVVVFGEFLYQRPLLVAGGLVALAGALIVVDRTLTQDGDTLQPADPAVTTWDVLKTVSIAWAAGVTPAALFGAAGLQGIGNALGALGATVVLGSGLYYGIRNTVEAVRTAAATKYTGERPGLAIAYRVLRRLAPPLLTTAGLLAIAYIAVALATGRIVTVAWLLTQARLEVQAAVAIFVALVIALLVYWGRDIWPELRTALGDAALERAVRVQVFGRGLPIFTIIILYLVTSKMVGPVLAFPLALLAGLTVRGIYLASLSARYRVRLTPDRNRDVRRVIDRCYQVTDADDNTHYVVEVNGTRLAHTDPDQLAEYVADAHADLLDDDTDSIRPSLATHYARDLFELGITHVDTDDQGTPSTRKRLEAAIRRGVYGTLNEEGDFVREDTLRKGALEEYPDPLVEEKLSRWSTLGSREGLLRRNNGYIRRIA